MQGSKTKLYQISQFSSDLLNVNNKGITGIASAGTVTNIDLKLDDDNFITGGVLRTNTSTFGDHATFQVIDLDNVMGYGAGVILGQYCTDWYMRSDVQEQLNENTPYPAKIYAGLYLRLKYTSVGTTDVQVSVMYRLHKILV